MKVMQLLPDLNQGGVERGTIDISRALSEAGHESVVISGGGRLVPELEAHGARHIVLPIGRKAFATLLIWWRLLGLLKSERPDIVHLRSRLPAWVFWVAYRLLPLGQRPRVVTTLHGMNSVSRYSQVMLRGDHLIAVSQTCLQYWRDHYPAAQLPPHSVIYRGIDTEFFRETPSSLRSELGAGKDTLVIAFPGRITPWKGHRDLIGVVKELAAQDRDFQVWVVGEAKPGSDFEREIRAASSELPQIKFLGHRSDMPAVLSAADVTLSLTSTTMESFGRGPVESIACGTPVIAFDHGAVGETLRALQPDGLVQVGDIQAVVAKLSDLPAVPNSIEPFTLSQMRALTLDVYQGLMRPRVMNLMLSTEDGGLQRVFENYGEAIRQQGLVCVDVANPNGPVFRRLPKETSQSFSASNDWSFFAVLRLRALIKKNGVTRVITHGRRATVLARKALGNTDQILPVVHSKQLAFLSGYDRVIHIAQHQKLALKAVGVSSFIHVPNGVEPVSMISRPVAIYPRAVGFVGRLHEIKDPLRFVEMATKLSAYWPDTEFLIFGDGPLRGSVEIAIRQAGLNNNIKMMGWVSSSSEIYEKLDLVLLTSRSEQQPLVILEAFSAGILVCSTPCEGAIEILAQAPFGGVVTTESDVINLWKHFYDDPERHSILRSHFDERYSLTAQGVRLSQALSG